MKMLYRGVLGGAIALVVVGCDLAPEASRIPTTMEIAPNDTMLLVDDQAKLRLVVYDQNGEEMPGPPPWAPAKWFVDVVAGHKDAITISPEGNVIAKKRSSLSITAFSAGMEPAKARLRINPSSVLISVPSYYFNQVNQNPDGTVPILANRQALLRVFVTGDEASYFRPNVRADFFRDGQGVHSVQMVATWEELGTEMEEGTLTRNYNAVIPGDVLQPGTELVIEVDPEGTVPRKPGSQTRIPAQGKLPLNIIGLKNHHQTIVPTIRNVNPQDTVDSSWSSNLHVDTEHIRRLRNFLPIADITVEAHATIYTDANLAQFAGWIQYLGEVRVLWHTEGERGYYFGAVDPFPGSALGGIASDFGWPHASVGLATPDILVHEVGHSMNLRHAPCGGAGGPDPNYPYAGGGIGMWAYDFRGDSLVDPGASARDFMGYCFPDWVSDYHFDRAMRYRVRSEGEAEPPPPPEQTLMLWGSASEEGARLEPAFMIESPPTKPTTGGPYRLEGFGPAGEQRFSFNFTPDPLEHGGGYFLFALPYDPDRDGVIERIVLSGPEGEDVLTPGSTPPMAIIRDGPDGPIRAFLRDWDGTVPAGIAREGLFPEVMLSDGIPGGVR